MIQVSLISYKNNLWKIKLKIQRYHNLFRFFIRAIKKVRIFHLKMIQIIHLRFYNIKILKYLTKKRIQVINA